MDYKITYLDDINIPSKTVRCDYMRPPNAWSPCIDFVGRIMDEEQLIFSVNAEVVRDIELVNYMDPVEFDNEIEPLTSKDIDEVVKKNPTIFGRYQEKGLDNG